MHIRELIVAVVSLIALHLAGQFVPAAARYDGLISETVFTYDANGNMTSDGRKGLEMNWNLLNLADSAAMHGSSLTYAYLSDGSKTAARVSDGNGAAGERRYIGAFVFDGGDFESVAWDEGRIFADVPVAADSTAGVDSLARGYRDCWTAVDPVSISTSETSPFTYCINNPVSCYDPAGLTTYSVNGVFRVINDGFDEIIYVSSRQFKRISRIWNSGAGQQYDKARLKLKDANGYIDAEGNNVLAAASISDQSHPIPVLVSTRAIFLLDLSTPETTDVLPYKWIAYAGAFTAAEVANFIAKRDHEIAGIRQRSTGPDGIQYSLRATHSGWYPNVRGGQTYLKPGDVWKYGETTQHPPENRYGGKEKIEKCGQRMIKETQGNQKQIKIAEKYKLYQYYKQNGHLPPGNSIFR